MKTDKNTPGPWFFTYLSGGMMGVCAHGRGLILNITAERERIKGGMTAEEEEANARLVAAAPALRDALREMMRQFEPCDPGDDGGISDCDAIVLARAALAAAEPEVQEFGPYSPPDPLPGKRVLRRELTPAVLAINALFERGGGK